MNQSFVCNECDQLVSVNKLFKHYCYCIQLVHLFREYDTAREQKMNKLSQCVSKMEKDMNKYLDGYKRQRFDDGTDDSWKIEEGDDESVVEYQVPINKDIKTNSLI